jgi:ferritin-like metal-binding protein YciE
MLDLKPRGETCAAMDGILEEGQDIVTETSDADARDAGMIASAQAVEHYEITRYGTMVAWANELGRTDAARLLQANLDQEYAADRKLSELAEKRLNREAA